MPALPPKINLFAFGRTALPLTSNVVTGAAVPIPTLLVEKSYTRPEVSIARPPANVEVALEEVATKCDASTSEVKRPEPVTSNLYEGESVPRPSPVELKMAVLCARMPFATKLCVPSISMS